MSGIALRLLGGVLLAFGAMCAMSGIALRLLGGVLLAFGAMCAWISLLRLGYGDAAMTGPDARGLTMALGAMLVTGGAAMRWGMAGAVMGLGATMVLAAVTP